VTRAATWLLAVTGLGLGALIATQGPGGHGLLMATVGHSYWALFFGAVLWLGVAAPTPGWLHRQRWLHWLARYSYGLYVVHFPLRQWLASEGLTATELAPRWGILGGGAMGLAIGVAASCALAVPLWHWFERPILDRGGKWLERRLRTARRSAESERAVAGVAEA
jgi:peptidoglycan/LPS O-acetylase OafA/YrhL